MEEPGSLAWRITGKPRIAGEEKRDVIEGKRNRGAIVFEPPVTAARTPDDRSCR